MSDSNTIQESRTKQRFSRQQQLILLGLIGVNLCVFGAMWLMTQGSGTVSSPPTLIAGEKLELQEAYEQALALAMGWQADVQVIGATTSWQLAAGDAFTLYRPAWSFSFYSPTARRVQIVTVDHGGAQAGPEQPSVTAPQCVAVDWSMGSDDLVLVDRCTEHGLWLDQGELGKIMSQIPTTSDDPKWTVVRFLGETFQQAAPRKASNAHHAPRRGGGNE